MSDPVILAFSVRAVNDMTDMDLARIVRMKVMGGVDRPPEYVDTREHLRAVNAAREAALAEITKPLQGLRETWDAVCDDVMAWSGDQRLMAAEFVRGLDEVTATQTPTSKETP